MLGRRRKTCNTVEHVNNECYCLVNAGRKRSRFGRRFAPGFQSPSRPQPQVGIGQRHQEYPRWRRAAHQAGQGVVYSPAGRGVLKNGPSYRPDWSTGQKNVEPNCSALHGSTVDAASMVGPRQDVSFSNRRLGLVDRRPAPSKSTFPRPGRSAGRLPGRGGEILAQAKSGNHVWNRTRAPAS